MLTGPPPKFHGARDILVYDVGRRIELSDNGVDELHPAGRILGSGEDPLSNRLNMAGENVWLISRVYGADLGQQILVLRQTSIETGSDQRFIESPFHLMQLSRRNRQCGANRVLRSPIS